MQLPYTAEKSVVNVMAVMADQLELQALDGKNHKQVMTFQSDANQKLRQSNKNIEENGIPQKAKWTKLLAISGIAATLGTTVPAGYAIGVVNSPAEHIQKWTTESLKQRYGIVLSSSALDMLWSAIVSIFLVGGAVGSLSGAWTADKFGRKRSLLFAKLMLITAAIGFFSCRQLNSVEMLISGRFLVGLAAGLSVSILPMYLSEIAPLDLRGTLGVFCCVGLTGGVVVGQIFSLQSIFGSASLWHIALSFYMWLVIAALIPYKWFPESPKWLFVINKDAGAAEMELQRLRNANECELITKELENMKAESTTSSQTMGFAEVLIDYRYFLPLIIVFVYQAGQQLSGINAIFYYSVSIFQRAGLTRAAAEWANLGAGSLNLAISLCGPYLMAKYNRRPLMLFSSFFCFLALMAFAVMLYFIDYVSWFAVGCIFCIFAYIFFFQFGVGPIPFFIASELFEVYPRPVAMAFGSLSSFSGNFLVGMTFPSLQNAWGALVFLPFATTCAIMFALTYFYLPETKRRNPTEVAKLIEKGFSSKVK